MTLYPNDIRDAAFLSAAAYRPRDALGNFGTAYDALAGSNWVVIDEQILNTLDINDFTEGGIHNGYFDNLSDQALVAYREVDKTLAISFRGSDSWFNWLTNLSNGASDFFSDYLLFNPLFAAISAAVTGGTLNYDRILVTGHSLGGAIAEIFLDQHSGVGYENVLGITFGSPGNNELAYVNSGFDPRLLNLWHTGDPVHDATLFNVNNGLDIGLDLPDQPDHSLPGLLALLPETGEHDMSLYKLNAQLLTHSDHIFPTFAQGPSAFAVTIEDFGDATGGGGRDYLIGGSDGTTLFGDVGDDLIYGWLGNDRLIGWAGDDILDGGSGSADTAVFRLASDHYNIDRHGDQVTVTGKFAIDLAADGSDTLYNIERLQFTDQVILVEDLIDLDAGTTGGGASDGGSPQGNTSGSEQDTVAPAGETINGDAADNHLYGTGGPDVINGHGGNDVLTGYSGQDSFDGGLGSDTVDYSYNPADVSGTVDLAAGAADFPGFYVETLTSIENVWMGAGDDELRGDDGPNDLRGGPGDDVIVPGGGDDIVYGDWKYSDQGGNDTVVLPYTFGEGYTLSGSPTALNIAGADGDDWFYNVEGIEFAGGVTKTAIDALLSFNMVIIPLTYDA